MTLPYSEAPSSDPEPTYKGLTILVGPRGFGKTYMMVPLAEDAAAPDRQTIVSPIGALAAYMNHPYTRLRGQDREACEKVFGAILHSGVRQVVLADEFDEYCPGGVTGAGGGYVSKSLYDLVNYGRNDEYQIGMIVSCRGTADVTTNVIRAADHVFFFQCTEPNALDYVRRWMKQGDIDFVTIVRALPKYVALGWEPGNDESKFTGFWKVIHGKLQSVTPDDPEWDPEWKETDAPTEETNPETDPPRNESSDGTPTPTPSSGPSTPPSTGDGA